MGIMTFRRAREEAAARASAQPPAPQQSIEEQLRSVSRMHSALFAEATRLRADLVAAQTEIAKLRAELDEATRPATAKAQSPQGKAPSRNG